MNDELTIDATSAIKKLECLNIDVLDKEKDLKKIISTVLRKARSSISKDAKGNLKSDPRQAYKAVRNSVYKRILGGQVNILPSRRASGARQFQKVRKLDSSPNQWGGNRRARSQRTEQVDSYWGKDRGFILRFQNAGTTSRTTRYGARGHITARNWFASSSHTHMQTAAAELCQLIDKAIEEVWNAG